jgi:hypothetical protein
MPAKPRRDLKVSGRLQRLRVEDWPVCPIAELRFARRSAKRYSDAPTLTPYDAAPSGRLVSEHEIKFVRHACRAQNGHAGSGFGQAAHHAINAGTKPAHHNLGALQDPAADGLATLWMYGHARGYSHLVTSHLTGGQKVPGFLRLFSDRQRAADYQFCHTGPGPSVDSERRWVG